MLLILFWENFIQKLPYVLPTKFQLICSNSFREDFFKLVNHKHELPMVATLVVWLAQNVKILYKISNTSVLQSNNSLYPLVSQEKSFLNFSQSETRIAHGDHVFWSNGDETRNSYIEPSIELPMAAMTVNGSGWNEQSL